MAISADQNLPYIFDFGGHLLIFEAAITYIIEFFKAENNFQTTSKQLQNNFQKAQKTDVLSPKIVKMILIHIWFFEVKNNPQSTSEQLQSKLQNIQKDSFWLKND